MGILRRLFGRKYIPLSERLDAPDELVTGGDCAFTSVHTDTAAIVIYDLGALKHRLDDDVDWWADPLEEIVEINNRNLLIIGLGSDGFYDLDVSDAGGFDRSYSLFFPSGRVFIGAGEMVTGGGDEPDERCGGLFLDFAPGDYTVGIEWCDARLRIGIIRSASFENKITEPIRIF